MRGLLSDSFWTLISQILPRLPAVTFIGASWPGRIKLKGSFRELIWKASKQARKVGGILSRQSDLECRQWCHTGAPPCPCTRTLTVTTQPGVWINVARTGTHKQGRLGMISIEVTVHGQNPAHKPAVSGKEFPEQLSRCKDHMSQPNTGSRQGAQEK